MIISIQHLTSDVLLGLWQMVETPEQLYEQYAYLRPYEQQLNRSFRHDGRKLEFLCVRALLRNMLPACQQAVLTHEPSGRPVLSNGWQLSISHTRGYAAVILSERQTVAVDIEYVSNRVENVAHKYIRPDEEAPTLTDKLLNWSAKETAYKYYSAENLQFFDMRVTNHGDYLRVENLKRGVSLKVFFRSEPAYVLTYAYEEMP